MTAPRSTLGDGLSCAYHRHCIFTGNEVDRCPRCHRSWYKIADDLGYAPNTYSQGFLEALHEREHK